MKLWLYNLYADNKMRLLEDVLVALANLKGFFAIWFQYNLNDSSTSSPSLVKYTNKMSKQDDLEGSQGVPQQQAC